MGIKSKMRKARKVLKGALYIQSLYSGFKWYRRLKKRYAGRKSR